MFHNSSNITDQLSEVNDTYTNKKNIEIKRVAENSVEVFFAFGPSVFVNISMGVLYYTIAIPQPFKGSKIRGLLGNFNDDYTDDLTSPNGTVYNASYDAQMYAFGESCKFLMVAIFCSFISV